MGWKLFGFDPRMAQAILMGYKCCTTRKTRKGVPGDKFSIGSRHYRILDIMPLPLREVRDKFYRLEGFSNPEEFEALWRELYCGFDEDKLVYLHWFARMEEL